MHSGPVVWDQANRRHIVDDHPERELTVEEVTEAMEDDGRMEEFDSKRRTYALIGRTGAGRVLFVACVERKGGRYPVHARVASMRLRGRYSR